jgi:cellulose biosynthesis protein BcsQ
MLRVSFYSYKGGAGRSTTSWNTIQRLIAPMDPDAKHPFVIVDTDTESAGSTFLYEAEDFFLDGPQSQYQSVQRRMTDKTEYLFRNDSDKEKFFKGMLPIGKKYFGAKDDNAVLLIGANINKNEFDSTGTTAAAQDQINNFRKNIVTACKACGAKALFFDTPSGTQFLARKSIELSEIIVCCMRPTTQFRKGTKRQLIDFIKEDLEGDYEKKYILTPTVVCLDPDQEFKMGGEKEPRKYPKYAKTEIEREFETVRKDEEEKVKQAFINNVLKDMLKETPSSIKEKTEFNVKDDNDLVFGIPEIKRFKWFEMYLAQIAEEGGELTDNDKIAINRYEYLAQTILKHRIN